jgi:hypothetical protein
MEKEEEKEKEEGDDPLLSYEGPIFRIMWGKGVDEDQALEQHAFDPYSLSAPLGGDVDAVAMPLSSLDTKTSKSTKQTPQIFMRVSVRFDQNQWYGGTILRVTKIKMPVPKEGTTPVKKIPPRRKKFKLRIVYDDGAKEEAYFPDPDILLRPPGMFVLSVYFVILAHLPNICVAHTCNCPFFFYCRVPK